MDGAGKSTQIDMLSNHFTKIGETPVIIWTRGGYTKLFDGLKAIVRKLFCKRLPPSGHNPKRNLAFSRWWIRCLWLNLALADLLWVYGVQIRLFRCLKRVVICDRYLWDTAIDFRLNFPQEKLDNYFLWRLLVKIAPEPDVAFLMLVTVEESVRRSKIKDEPFPDPPEVLQERLERYLTLTKKLPFHVLDGSESAAKLQKDILTSLKNVSLS